MIDYFALLDEPHHPWLEPDLLKKKFLNLSGGVHPDRVHTASDAEKSLAQKRYAELNQAYNQLKHPKERLQHLLELETGAKPAQVQQVPAELLGFFVEVGQLFKQTDEFLLEKSKTSSPLVQVQMFEAAQGWTDKLIAIQRQLNARHQELIAELKAIDARWVSGARSDPVARATMLRRLEEIHRLLSYFGRWESQIQEKIFQLSL
jgi:DnaJ-domain-containing protein 1